MISISKIMVPLLFPDFLVYVVKFGRVLVTREKFTVAPSNPDFWKMIMQSKIAIGLIVRPHLAAKLVFNVA